MSMIVFAFACNPYEQDSFEADYFIEAYLVEGKPFDKVRLSTTSPFEEKYSFSDVAVSGAEVYMFKLDRDCNRTEQFKFYESNEGIYRPVEELIPEPRNTYELLAIAQGSDTLRTFSTIPDTFSVAEIIRQKATFSSEEQVQVRLTQSWFPGRQNKFILTAQTLAPEEYHMTPYYYSDKKKVRNRRHRVRSNIISQSKYDVYDDGTFKLNYPWLAVAWFGPNKVYVHTIDDNIYDYYRSQDIQIGRYIQAPGQIQNPITNVEGGKGLFGSMTGVSFEIYVDYPPDFEPSGY